MVSNVAQYNTAPSSSIVTNCSVSLVSLHPPSVDQCNKLNYNYFNFSLKCVTAWFSIVTLTIIYHQHEIMSVIKNH